VNFSQFLAAAHISTVNVMKWLRLAHAAVKEGYPLKSGYFTAIRSCSVKTVADRYRHAAYHNKHWRRAF